jgi:hypothetical protein
MSVVQQLGGVIRPAWKASGLCVEIDVLSKRLSREL